MAWDEFWTRYWRAVFNFAKCRGCSEHTAEEVVQDVMLSVFEKRHVFRYDPSKGRFRDWLGGVVRNLVSKRRAKPALHNFAVENCMIIINSKSLINSIISLYGVM